MYKDSNFYHSSEGSTWTKKNHKYIRKEGNRYIYPEDLKKISNQHSNRMAAANGKVVNPIATWRGSDGKVVARVKTNEKVSMPTTSDYKKYGQLRGGETNRSKTVNKQGSPDYKKLSEQHANRKAAANGKVVNPIATWRGSDGKVLARVKTNEKVSMPTTSDYKKYGQLRGGEANRSKMVNKQGSQSGQDYAKQKSRDHADQQKEIRELARMERQDQNRKYPGSGSKGYEDAKKQKRSIDIAKKAVNEYEKNKDGRANEYARQIKASKEYYDAVRSNTRNENEFNDYLDKHGVARPDSSESKKTNSGTSKPTVSKSKSVETWDNSKNIKTWDSETAKKSTKGQKGHFTVQDGKTVFVSDDPATKKRVSKGKRIVDKVKRLFKKK